MAKSVNGGGGGGGNSSGGGGGANNNNNNNNNNNTDNDTDNETTTPICRCRVLYLGSAVPHITKDGLQGIQEPLRDLYPEQGVFWNTDRDHIATGIDSWLSVWSNGILVENVDDKGNTIRRFHPIESLHYCAAVRFVSVPAASINNSNDNNNKNGSDSSSSNNMNNNNNKIAKFLPLDSPFSKSTVIDPMKAAHPPLFACILRRTSGIKVLECHAFICKKEAAANALVRCCFHAYADTMHAKQIELESPYEQLDKRRSRSIGSALDSQSLIDDKVNNWQKNSNGAGSAASSGGGSPGAGADDNGTNGFLNDNRSLSRQKQPRTPSVASLVSHSMAELPPPPHHGMIPGHNMMMEPIYYNGGAGAIPPTGTLRSVRSFISLAALKSHNKKSRQHQQARHQIPLPFMAPPPPPLSHPVVGPPPHPHPVMFATLSKKELKKVLKKESTLKRKHKYKDFPMPFMAPNGFPFIYGPPVAAPPPPPPPGPPQMHHGPGGPMAIYAPLPPPLPGGPNSAFYGTIDSRKGRPIPLPPPPPPPPPPSMSMANMMMENGHPHHMPPPPPPPGSSAGHFIDEPIYMPAVPSPNGTLRPVTPHGGPAGMPPADPIYLESRNGIPGPLGVPPGPGPVPGQGPPLFMPHPQIPGSYVPCTFVPTLSRKELKELEKQKQQALKKAAKKEKKNKSKNQKSNSNSNNNGMMMNGVGPAGGGPIVIDDATPPNAADFYSPPRPPYGYAPHDDGVSTAGGGGGVGVIVDPDESLISPSEMQLSSGNYSNSSTTNAGGIYKKKGHLNERAFSYSIRQEHRSRSNSLSNLAFENGGGGAVNGSSQHHPHHHHHREQNGQSSHNTSSISLKSSDGGVGVGNPKINGGGQPYEMTNGNGRMINGAGGGGGPPLMMDGSGIPIDPNTLATRMSNLSLKNGYGPNNPPPPPPPLPPNGYHHSIGYQRTATIKRL